MLVQRAKFQRRCAADRSPATRTATCRARGRNSAGRRHFVRAAKRRFELQIVPELFELFQPFPAALRSGAALAPTMHAPLIAPMETPVTDLSMTGLPALEVVHQREQRLDRAPLIGAERAAALQHETDFDAGPFRRHAQHASRNCDRRPSSPSANPRRRRRGSARSPPPSRRRPDLAMRVRLDAAGRAEQMMDVVLVELISVIAPCRREA